MGSQIWFLIGIFWATSLPAEERFSLTTTPGKLPKDIIPRAYVIHLEPNTDDLVTAGSESEQLLGPDEKLVTFDRTPAMASYLFVLACGKLEWIEDEVAGVKVRVLTTPGKKEIGRYALEVTKEILPYYNEYFGVPYPLPKLDQIALPSGFGGAMENWGGITYNEDLLLFNPQASSDLAKQRIFQTMAHEIAHTKIAQVSATEYSADQD
jgi:aminopeptidase N